MIFKTNNESIELYLRHIVQEVFPKKIIDSSETLYLHINTADNQIYAKASIRGVEKIHSEHIDKHPSVNIATSCAIGKSIIDIGLSLGYSIPPYGVLTGVRPIKVASSVYDGRNIDTFAQELYNKYLLSYKKSTLLYHCISFDRKIRHSHSKKDISIYISIPFCPSRCYYCSFVSFDVANKKALIPRYLELVYEEIERMSEIVYSNSLNVKSVYIGGGTPGILTADQIKQLLLCINKYFPSRKEEFTFEIGRPETVSKEKLIVLIEGGVNRISVNTQTTNNDILKLIGRNHTSEDYFRAVSMALDAGFYSVNTDIIAGLEKESFESFKKSVSDVISTGVDNITVHTLCVKKSSALKESSSTALCKNIDDFVNFSKDFCISSGYLPYYLYRQKYALGGHESVGYCKDNKYSYYNIAMMNEIESVIGIGAGATTRIESNSINEKYIHLENYKYPIDYIRDKEKMYAHTIAVANALNNNS